MVMVQEGSFFQPLITEEVIRQVDIPTDQISIPYKNVDYLERAAYIYGVTPNRCPYPKWIRIEPQGKDIVESKEAHYANLHWNIRFRILSVLYDRYFSEENEETIQVIPDIISEFVSPKIDQNLILAYVIYLHRKYLITGIIFVSFASVVDGETKSSQSFI